MSSKLTRVSELAKELGVKSKDITERCQQEKVKDPPKTASSGVKAGLAMMIREWFQEATPKQEAAPVAKEEAKSAKADKLVESTAAKTKASEISKPVAKTATAKTKSIKAAAKKPKASAKAVPTEAVAATKAKPAKATKPKASKTTESTGLDAEAKAKAKKPTRPARSLPGGVRMAEKKPLRSASMNSKPAGVQNVPDRPTDVKPIGEQLAKPKKAKMSGPRVIRVEEAENVPVPGRRDNNRGPRPQGGQRGSNGYALPTGQADGFVRSQGPNQGGGIRSKFGPDAPSSQGGEKNRGKGNARSENRRSGGLRNRFASTDSDENNRYRRRGGRGRGKSQKQQVQPIHNGVVEIEEPISIKVLSSATGIKAADCVAFLFKRGIMSNVNATIDTEMAMEIAMDHEIELIVKEHVTASAKIENTFAEREKVDVGARPPVVTVMGHVDHGKTSLLDAIRKEDIATHEAGGITQHVGAYRVQVAGEDGEEKTVVFLDTPGHAAFTAMRARGAKLTDIVVLLVAADDGVMPQTIESINHAQAAEVPVVVALNKCDLPGVNDDQVQKIYGQLAEHGLNPSAWGGETEVIRCSAQTGEGIKELLEILDLEAQVLELTADYGGPARGSVIEAEMQPGRGAVARVMVQDGTLRVGDFFVAGRSFGRVRSMIGDRGQALTTAGPTTPVEVSGIDLVPDIGGMFFICKSLKEAEEVAQQARDDERLRDLSGRNKVTMANFSETLKAGQINYLNVVVKGDVQGSVETIRYSLGQIGNDEVAVRLLHSGIGPVTENDVLLAEASDAMLFAFHVTIPPAVREIAENRGVEIRQYRVIYNLTDDVVDILEGKLAPDVTEEEIGRADVKQVFKIGKIGNIAGCMVSSGYIRKEGTRTRLERDGQIITEGRPLGALRRVKDDVKEVRTGTECGIRIENFEDIKEGDVIVCYTVKETARKLSAEEKGGV